MTCQAQPDNTGHLFIEMLTLEHGNIISSQASSCTWLCLCSCWVQLFLDHVTSEVSTGKVFRVTQW